MRTLLALALTVLPAVAQAAPLTVAVGAADEDGDANVRTAFRGFVAALAKVRPDVTVVFAPCSDAASFVNTTATGDPDRDHGCGDADGIARLRPRARPARWPR